MPLPTSSYEPRRIEAAIERGPVIASIELTPFESAAFDYFRLFTVNQLPQKLWWQHLVLDLGRTEPALAHAATALGSMHRSLTLSSQPRVDKTQHEFAVGQYGKAMRLMRQYIERGQKHGNKLRENEIVVVPGGEPSLTVSEMRLKNRPYGIFVVPWDCECLDGATLAGCHK